MGRTALILSVCAVLALAFLPGCSSNSAVSAKKPNIPASLTLTPATSLSVDVGAVQTFTSTAHNSSGTIITAPITFQSSNPAVLTIAANGLACAGSWDSLTLPVVCTPGPAGVANVTAVSSGVSSPPTTVFVHQHIDRIVMEPVVAPTEPCMSKDLFADYQATAYSGTLDISSTVGPFTFQSNNFNVAKLTTSSTPLPTNQAQYTASVPGFTQIFASAGGVTSLPLDFTTCAVASISLEISGEGGTSVTVAKGTTKTIVPTVIDSLGVTITGVPLTWTSTQPTQVAVTTSGTVSTPGIGGASIVASCTPPTCNPGFVPSLPIYPPVPVSVVSTGTATAGTVVATSTGCTGTDGCISIVAIIGTPGNAVGVTANLLGTPNSILYNHAGNAVYIGSYSGLMAVDPATIPVRVSQFTSATGKVLAISHNDARVIVSDTTTTPNRVTIIDVTTGVPVTLPITGATAAAFTPDDLKAFIVAGSTLYVYSTLDPLQTIPLSAAANDVTIFPSGAFAYLAGGAPSAVSVFTTCTPTAAPEVVGTPVTPAFIRALPNATQVIAADSPGVDVISVTDPTSGCPPAVSNSVTSINLGQGSFTPLQLLIAPDSTRAYILASNLASVLIYNTGGQSSSAIQIANDALPLHGTLSPDGNTMYVAASDALVHVIDTVSGGDIQQITFPTSLCSAVSFTCNADLVAAKP